MSDSFFGSDDDAAPEASSMPPVNGSDANETTQNASFGNETLEDEESFIGSSAPVDRSGDLRLLFYAFVVVLLSALIWHLYNVWDRKRRSKYWTLGLDGEEYELELPPEALQYEEEKQSGRYDKPGLCRLLLQRAMADIPLIERLEKDMPGTHRVWNAGIVPRQIWDEVQDAEGMLLGEVEDVRAEANRLQKGWGDHVFPHAFQELKKMKAANEGTPEAKERLASRKQHQDQYCTLTRLHAVHMVCASCLCTSTDEDDDKMKKCAQCGEVWYCGRECQLKDWKEGGHKEICKKKQS